MAYSFPAPRYYPRDDFAALPPNAAIDIALLRTRLGELALSAPIDDVRPQAGNDGVLVYWITLPDEATILAVDAAIAAFAGGVTTSQPFVYESFAASTNATNTHAAKIDETTPPLDGGTYQVSWVCSTRMQAVLANTGVEAKIRLERSDGQFVEQDDAWDRANRHAYNGSQPFEISAGQTIRAILSFARLGASGTAEMSGARVTIDQLSG